MADPARSHHTTRLSAARCGLALALVLAPLATLTAPVLAQDAAKETPKAAAPAAEAKPADKAANPAKPAVDIPIVVARQLRDEPLPLSLLDLPPPDLGIAGAKLAIKDNNTTGQFMNQKFTLDAIEEADPEKLIKDVVQKVDSGAHFILVDVTPDTLLKLADTLGNKALLINYSAPDDRLREEDCRPQIMHTAPTRSMLADALAQYLIWKKWNRWFLVLGPQPKDKLFADALRRAAKRFGAKIVEERTFEYQARQPARRRRLRAGAAADPHLHPERARLRRLDRRRRGQPVRRLPSLQDLGRTARGRHLRPRRRKLASGY